MRSTLGEVYTSRRRHSTCTLLVAPLVTIYTRYASPSPSPLPSPLPLRSPPRAVPRTHAQPALFRCRAFSLSSMLQLYRPA